MSKYNINFKKIAWLTFTTYLITTICGYFNLFLAHFSHKNYFPLKSYLIIFSNEQIKNIHEIQRGIYNLAGFKAIFNTNVPYKTIDNLFFILISTTLVILFFVGYKVVQLNKITQREIIKWSIIFSLLMAFAIPENSSDLYYYIASGAQQSLYNQNPYITTLDQIKGYNKKSILLNDMWPLQPATYGPVFIYLTKLIVSLSCNNFFLSVIGFKLLNLTLFIFFILFLLKTHEAKNIYLVAWNPLILIQGLWNCHNDLISGILISLALSLLTGGVKSKNYFWGVFCLTFAIGIKYVPIIIIPIIFLYIFKNLPKKNIFASTILGFCFGIALILICSVHYLFPLNQFNSEHLSKITTSIGYVHQSLIATIFTIVRYFCMAININCNLFQVDHFLKCFFYIVFGLFYLYVILGKKTDLTFDITLVLFVLFAFTIAKFHSWYLLNLIFLIPLLKEGILKNCLIALSITHTYAITFLDQAKILNFTSLTLLPVLFILFRRIKSKSRIISLND